MCEKDGHIGSTNSTLLTIVLPFDFTGVVDDSVMILRHHGGAGKLTEDPAEGNEGFAVDKDAGTITIYAKKFSTYAAAYAVPSNNGSRGGSYAPGHTVTSDLDNITKVTVDGKTVDSRYYTVTGGSVYLSGEFMKTLPNGKHTVKLYQGIKTATGTFTVVGSTAVAAAPTGDTGVVIYGVLTVGSVLGMGWLGRKKHGAK